MERLDDVPDGTLRSAVDASTEGVAVLDAEGDYRYVNEAHAAAYGVDDPERMLGWNWRRLYDDDAVERLEATAMAALDRDGAWRGEAVARRVDGEPVRLAVSLTALDDGGVVSVVRGVGERHATETDRRLRAEQLETVLENVPLVLFALDDDGTFTLMKGKGLAAIPLDPAATVGETARDVLPEDSEILADIDRALDGERFSTTQTFGEREFETVYQPVYEDGQISQVIGVALDVTERERFRRRLSALHEATRELAYANSEAEVVARVVDTVEEVVGRSMVAFWRADDGVGESMEPVATSDAALELADGDLASVTPGTVEMDAFESGEVRVIRDYGSLSAETASDAPLGTVVLLPVGDHGFLSVGTREVRDVPASERRLLEVFAGNAAAALDSAAREREIAERSDRTDFLNSLLRHDLINGLQVTQARLDAASDHVAGQYEDDVEFARDWCGEAMEFIEKTRAVLNAIANEDHRLEPVDVADVAREAAASVRDRYPNATVDVSAPDGAVVVAADEMVSEVVGNVVSNAVAHHDGDDPTVELTVQRDDETATVTVADDGPGITADTIGRIFDRGETTDPDGGSGFGLYFVDVMMDKYGGTVEAWNRDGQGAAFELTFERL